jgi:hypothetical protein
MKIGIIGTGRVGASLGKAFAAKGHSVMFGSRDPHSGKTQAIIREVNKDTLAGTISEAIGFGEVITLATPWTALDEVIKAGGDWRGKIIIDATNRIGVHQPTSIAEEIAAKASGAKVVKAFNTIGAEHYGDPWFGDQVASMFICGDDVAAKSIVGGLVQELGFDLVDAGSLAQARYLEELAGLWVTMGRSSRDRNIAFRLLRKGSL